MSEATPLQTTEPSPTADRTAHRLPGDHGMWVFVLGDLFIFLGYFVVFMVYRWKHPALFLASQRHLDLVAGLVDTLVLLISSRFIALVVVAARSGAIRRATRLVACGAASGLVFIGVKLYEWVALINGGYTLPRNEFFMFYFSLTGVHLFHLLLGLIVLGVVTLELRRTGGPRVNVVEAGALYWHMVDLIWVVLFALLYLMR